MNKRRWYALRHRATSILLALLAMGCVTGILVTVSNYMTNQERITRQLIREQQHGGGLPGQEQGKYGNADGQGVILHGVDSFSAR